MPPDRLDAIDRERFELMLASPPFLLYRARITAELERARADCEAKTEPAELYRAQGAARGLRVALDLPGNVLKEMTAATKRGTKKT